MKIASLILLNHFKRLFYLVVLIGVSTAHAGSYEDFFEAIKEDNSAKIISLLQRGFDPNTVDSTGLPGLMLAVKFESFRVAEALIRSPQTKAEVRNAFDESPLMLAALAGNERLCRMLIEKDADVNKPGWTPLHYAATKGHLTVMTMLLNEHAYIDAASPNSTTPLMMAAHYGTPQAVKLLLNAGADAMLKNELGMNALDFANKANRQDSAEIISAFVRASHSRGTW